VDFSKVDPAEAAATYLRIVKGDLRVATPRGEDAG
jgi:hypothetical protein